MSDYRNDDENKELTGQTMSDDHKTEEKHEDMEIRRVIKQHTAEVNMWSI